MTQGGRVGDHGLICLVARKESHFVRAGHVDQTRLWKASNFMVLGMRQGRRQVRHERTLSVTLVLLLLGNWLTKSQWLAVVYAYDFAAFAGVGVGGCGEERSFGRGGLFAEI